jgi:hypothetical protein
MAFASRSFAWICISPLRDSRRPDGKSILNS